MLGSGKIKLGEEFEVEHCHIGAAFDSNSVPRNRRGMRLMYQSPEINLLWSNTQPADTKMNICESNLLIAVKGHDTSDFRHACITIPQEPMSNDVT